MARILVAEDDGSVRSFVERALAHKEHDLTTVADGAEALEALAKGRYDLRLTDIVMPVMDGIALALKVSKDSPAMRVLMMTGYAAEKQRAHNLDILIHEVIVKPFSMKEIIASVEKARAG